MTGGVNSESKVEEIIAALWTIAALLAFLADMKTLAVLLGIKAFLDTATSIIFGIREVIVERKQKSAS